MQILENFVSMTIHGTQVLEARNVWKHKSLFRPFIQITIWLILH